MKRKDLVLIILVNVLISFAIHAAPSFSYSITRWGIDSMDNVEDAFDEVERALNDLDSRVNDLHYRVSNLE